MLLNFTSETKTCICFIAFGKYILISEALYLIFLCSQLFSLLVSARLLTSLLHCPVLSPFLLLNGPSPTHHFHGFSVCFMMSKPVRPMTKYHILVCIYFLSYNFHLTCCDCYDELRAKVEISTVPFEYYAATDYKFLFSSKLARTTWFDNQ